MVGGLARTIGLFYLVSVGGGLVVLAGVILARAPTTSSVTVGTASATSRAARRRVPLEEAGR